MKVTDVLKRLENVKKGGSGWQATCPAHDDRVPSLSIDQGSDGKILIHCYAGCTFESIINCLDLEPKDLMPSQAYTGIG